MEDSAQTHSQKSGHRDECVVRRFSPVRIERLLLKRLFDIATSSPDSAMPDESRDAFSVGVSGGNIIGVRREAA